MVTIGIEMHDELMSSMDISQKMLGLTACAILPIDGDIKHMNGIQTNDDNDSNDSAINDMNGTDSINPDNNELKARNDDSIKSLAISEMSSDETNHICNHFDVENEPKSDDNQSVGNESPNDLPNGDQKLGQTTEETDSSAAVEVLPNGLKVVNGCVEPEYDPPEDKCLRYTNQLQFLRTIMTKYLCRYKTALPFLKPVNCIQLKIGDYYKVIDNPMDMQTIKRRMMCLWYTSAQECLEDFKLMFNNCYKFNSCDNYVYKAGKKLEEYLEEKLKEMPKDEVEIACPPKQTAAESKTSIV